MSPVLPLMKNVELRLAATIQEVEMSLNPHLIHLERVLLWLASNDFESEPYS